MPDDRSQYESTQTAITAIEMARVLWLDMPKNPDMRTQVSSLLALWSIQKHPEFADRQHDAILQLMIALYHAPKEPPKGIE